MPESLTDSAGREPLIASRGSVFTFDAYVVGIVWLGSMAVFALGDGTLRFVAGEMERPSTPAAEVTAHGGAILCVAAHPDGVSVLSGGDDGRLVRSWPDGGSETLADFGQYWVDHLVTSEVSGVIVCSTGRDACVLHPGSAAIAHRYTQPRTVGGLALDATGGQLAVSHYGGVSIWPVQAADATPRRLERPGSHLTLEWSPDAQYLVATEQGNALVGWRLADGTSIRLAGYPTKSRSLAWTVDGRWLVSDGADRVVCWPFDGETGPIGRAPRLVGPGGLLVTRVARHPLNDAIVAGYEDGAVLLLRLEDELGAVIRGGSRAQELNGEDAVSALAWSADGRGLALGCENGDAGVLRLPAGFSR